jgi:hypothetical protein
MSAVISALTGSRAGPVVVSPLPGDQAAVPPQDGAWCDQPVPQSSGQVPDQRGEDRPVGPVGPPSHL